MRKFLLGLVCGLSLGIAGVAFAEAQISESGLLIGWTVVKDGAIICETPFAVSGARQIVCLPS
jgi:hypothetical protein